MAGARGPVRRGRRGRPATLRAPIAPETGRPRAERGASPDSPPLGASGGPTAVALLVAAGIGTFTACARQEAPPGGPPDRLPPIVVVTSPDTFARVEPFRDPVVFEFSERISERTRSGSVEDAVEVSPRTGPVRVEHNRRGLEVSLPGGFREGLVYRVILRPIIQDMFQNPLPAPYELVFSTGAEFEPNALAGVVTDRLTGQSAPDVRVNAVPEDRDSLVYTAVTDTSGFFALRYLPAGRYRVAAYQDRNRNFEVDFLEPQDSARVALEPSDTAVVELAVLRPDTTPARVARVEVEDSVTLRVALDDHLDPGSPLDEVEVSLSREEAGAPDVARVVHAFRLQEERARADSLARVAADSLAALEPAPDTLQAAPDTVPARDTLPAPPPGLRPGAPAGPAGGFPGAPGPSGLYGPDGRPLPSQTFYVILESPLEPGFPYAATVAGVTNLQGVAGGGGETVVTWEPPPEPPPDTAAVPDTAMVPDTVAVPDTAMVPDTAAVPDTAVVPDTAAVPAAERPEGLSRLRGPPRLRFFTLTASRGTGLAEDGVVGTRPRGRAGDRPVEAARPVEP